MERIFGLKKAAPFPRAIATLGVFDGVHRGHQAVLAETVRWAREAGGTSVVITFDRHPEAVLRKILVSSITSLEHRLSLIEKIGIDAAVILHFDQAMADMEPEDFARVVLVERLGVRGVLLGFNSRFGKGARGDAALLEGIGKRLGFEVRTAKPLLVDGAPVSSTLVRTLITKGELAKAAEFLGRPVSLLGTVVHGEHRGRRLGFPTANLNLHHEVTPPSGVYVCRVLVEGQKRWGLVNIGVRPTFHKDGEAARKTVEVYVDDYDAGEELYGRTIEVEIAAFVRHERRFDSPEALVTQMEKDRRFLRTFRDSAGGG
jgi:riboflavin kinase/FMN adenylyltransferase